MKIYFIFISLIFLSVNCIHQNSKTSKISYAEKIKYEPPVFKPHNKLLPGRYLGFLNIKERSVRLPLTVDIIESNSDKNLKNLSAVFKISLGSFDSDEYVTEFFNKIIFERSTKKLLFDPAYSQSIITRSKLRGNNVITGKFLHKLTGKSGKFWITYAGKRRHLKVYSRVMSYYPKSKVGLSLAGKYHGTCNSKKTTLILDTARWARSDFSRNQSLSGYKITGKLGHKDAALCGSKDKFCVTSTFTDGRYNFFTGELNLKGSPESRLCRVNKNGIICGSCVLSKEINNQNKDYGINQIIHRPERFDRQFEVGTFDDKISSLNGEYFGYLFHENLGKYQVFRLKVDTVSSNAASSKIQGLDTKQNSSIEVKGITTIFFGDPKSREFVVYKYYPKKFSRKCFVFDGPGEAFLQVNAWNNKGLMGVWYSKTFGRVGTVQLLKDSLPLLPKSAQIIKPLSGTFKSDRIEFSLFSAANISQTWESFFPLLVKGASINLDGKEKGHNIEKSSYDFYTGKISFLLDDGRVINGIYEGNQFKLTWPKTSHYGNIMTEQKSELYKKNLDAEPGQTAFMLKKYLKGLKNKLPLIIDPEQIDSFINSKNKCKDGSCAIY